MDQTKQANTSNPTKKSFVTSVMKVATLKSPSFKEDTYITSNLKPDQTKALQELRHQLSNTYSNDPSLEAPLMYGVPLFNHKDDSAADVILLKFLRAREFKVVDALEMLKKSLNWRKGFGADAICDENMEGFGEELEGVVAYMHGNDKVGHPVCYNAYGVFKEKAMYEKYFGDDEKVKKFLRWRVQVLEKGIKCLDFKAGGVNSLIQVTDMKDMPKRELRVASNQILNLFQDNYPEMVARTVFINVPWYFSMLYAMMSPFMTQRTKSKFVIVREGNVAETLYKFIKPENIPTQYGGLSKPSDLENDPPKPASEFIVKGGEKVNLEIEGIECGATIAWELVVGGWDLDYSAEFIPNAAGSYNIAVEKARRILPYEGAVNNSFRAKEAGKMILSVDNMGSRKKKVAAYRYIVRKTVREG